ncbi:MAG: hypothetical protein JW730_08750 [Anaerolineales bacterium]|nr:hypothetical protein [Anaerolineales bacterium]
MSDEEQLGNDLPPLSLRDISPKYDDENLGGVSNDQIVGFRGAGRTPQEQELVKREIESTDRQIDTLVYELYGLTEEEIRIVEGG